MTTQTSSEETRDSEDTTWSSRRKRVSKGIRRDLQEIDVGFSKAMQHVARGVADGMDEYVRRRDISAKRKRDGALRDLDLNVMRAATKAAGPISEAPADMLRASFRMRRTLRKGMRVVTDRFDDDDD
ncbi:MAG: hypothetical protein HN919_05690 [Verrucomicrobia bacterium]|jgi:hypothetical protein|nr:hypothetical protein [Verrucomicrobiota bacterium]MBT7065772.1 hypothetical protein [Verrucomicrobiota bacterium]MBT7700680.1 hypothetical protein [Verrucomicrobiota bacterium]